MSVVKTSENGNAGKEPPINEVPLKKKSWLRSVLTTNKNKKSKKRAKSSEKIKKGEVSPPAEAKTRPEKPEQYGPQGFKGVIFNQKMAFNYLFEVPIPYNPIKKVLFFTGEKTLMLLAFVAAVTAANFIIEFCIDLPVILRYPTLDSFKVLVYIAFLIITIIFSVNRVHDMGKKPLNEEQKAWMVLFCNELKEPLPSIHYMNKCHMAAYVRKAYHLIINHNEKYSRHMFATYL